MTVIEMIAGLTVRMDPVSPHASTIRRNITAIAETLNVRRVETDFTRFGLPGVVYHLDNPRVTIMGNADTGLELIQEGLVKARARVARHESDACAPRTIEAADVHLIRSLRCGAALRQISRTFLDPPRMWLWSGQDPSISPDAASVEIGEFTHLHLTGRRVWIGRGTEMETWSQGNLVTGRKLQIPDTVIAALKGRLLDDVVEGTMLAGAGLIIRKAWMTGGRLGMTFEKRELLLDDVMDEIHPRPRKAA